MEFHLKIPCIFYCYWDAILKGLFFFLIFSCKGKSSAIFFKLIQVVKHFNYISIVFNIIHCFKIPLADSFFSNFFLPLMQFSNVRFYGKGLTQHFNKNIFPDIFKPFLQILSYNGCKHGIKIKLMYHFKYIKFIYVLTYSFILHLRSIYTKMCNAFPENELHSIMLLFLSILLKMVYALRHIS